MRYNRLTIVFLCLLCAAAGLFSQTPTPRPGADQDEVVKISTKIIQFDVTVTDKSGRVVKDLRRDEIEVYANGKKQDLEGFSFVSKVSETTAPQPSGAPATGNLPPKQLRSEDVRRTIAIVVDDLSLSFESAWRVRDALKRFIEREMREGDVIAIIRTGSGIGALQQFTNDKRRLLQAIERIRFGLSGRVGSFEQVYSGGNRSPVTGALPAGRNVAAGDEDMNDFRRSAFAAGTLGAVGYVVRGMSDLPGRKSIMLVSEGFRLFDRKGSGGNEVMDQRSGRQGMMRGNDTLNRLRSLIDQANRASVVVHTLDARGLEIPGITAADSIAEMSENEVANIEESRRQLLADTQDGLRFLARETGGTAVMNSNDLAGGLRRVLDDQSYYLVSYEPDDATFDSKTQRFNTLMVKVTRPGLRVRYRSGFYGIAEENLMRDARSSAGERLINALVSPFAAGDVALRLNALFVGSKREGSRVRALLHIPTTDLVFSDQPGGLKRAVIDLIAVAYGEKGEAAAQELKTHKIEITREAFERSLSRGLVYDFSFPVKPGAYQLRVALRDHGGDKVGSANQFVEIPDVNKDRLAASDILLEGLTPDAVEARRKGADTASGASKLLIDTALRRFPTNSVLNFAMAIYNAKGSSSKSPNFTVQTRIFKDGTVVFEGQPKAFSPGPHADPASIEYGSSIALAASTEPGDYVLQVVITDMNNNDKKKNSVTRFVPFELIRH